MGFRPRQLIGQLDRRLPEQGRIRLGVQTPTTNGRTRPEKLATLRLTSPNHDVIAKASELWGGEARAWSNPKGGDEFEVITTVRELRVVLPDDPMGDTPIYELWSGGGLARRCDGEVAVVPRRTGNLPDDVEMDRVGCVCNARQVEECRPTTRLVVILPDLPFGGGWRLETHSWNAAVELPGMVDAIRALQATGFVTAWLGVREEEKVVAGKTKNFIVPYLRMDTTLTDALAGGAGMVALAAPVPAVAALTAGTPDAAAVVADGDDDIYDAEVIDLDDLVARAVNTGVLPDIVARAIIAVDGDERRLEAMVVKLEAGTHTLVDRGGRVVLAKVVAQ